MTCTCMHAASDTTMDPERDPPDPHPGGPSPCRFTAAGRLFARVGNSARRGLDSATNAIVQRAIQSRPEVTSIPAQTSENQSMSLPLNNTTTSENAPELPTRTTTDLVLTSTGTLVVVDNNNRVPAIEPIQQQQPLDETPASELPKKALFSSPEAPSGVIAPATKPNDDADVGMDNETASTKTMWVSDLEIEVIDKFIGLEGKEQQLIHDKFNQLKALGAPLDRRLEYTTSIIINGTPLTKPTVMGKSGRTPLMKPIQPIPEDIYDDSKTTSSGPTAFHDANAPEVGKPTGEPSTGMDWEMKFKVEFDKKA